MNEPIKITAIPDMSQISESTLKQIVDLERESFGYAGKYGDFGEYVVCKDPFCRAVQSINEVYKLNADEYTQLAILEKGGASIPNCPECGKVSELILEPKLYTKFLKSYYKKGTYGSLLLNSEESIHGITLAYKGTRREIVEQNINYRNSYNVDDVLQKISQFMGQETTHLNGNQPTICWNRIAISVKHRGSQQFNTLVSTTLNQHSEDNDLPLLGDTRYDSKLYPLIKALGFQDITHDKHGWVVVFHPSQREFLQVLSLSKSEFKATLGRHFDNEKKQQKEYMKSRPQERKHFKGAPLLSDLFSSSKETE